MQRGTALVQALKALGDVDDDFVAALESEQRAPLQAQEREAL
jgi:antitoxin VapB